MGDCPSSAVARFACRFPSCKFDHAVTHAGPAQASRIAATVCAEPFQPGVDPSTFAQDDAKYDQEISEVFATYPRSKSEPPLKCYVTASCRG